MRIQEQDGYFHAHADTTHSALKVRNYSDLVRNVFEVKFHPYSTLTVHLPFEIQHPVAYHDKEAGMRFIRFGEGINRLFRINLYWENAPELNYGQWDLRFDQTDWRQIPRDIELCLDVGHLMLKAETNKQAREKIREILEDRKAQVKHLHIHENDLIHDQHKPIGTVITEPLFQELIKGRTFIFERDALSSEEL